MKKLTTHFVWITLACIAGFQSAHAVTTTLVASGLSNPLWVTHAPNDFDRIFTIERFEARIRIITLPDNTLLPQHFLDIDSLVNNVSQESGLLGLAFHPDYWNNGYFYVYYTATNRNVLARYSVSPTNPDTALASSALILLNIYDPYSNHNGGCLVFGPDGYLYVGTGDGGDADDPQERAQNPDSLLGKMLRIDVDNTDPGFNYAIPPTNPYYGGTSPRPEIWARGLRNPWRWSFDRLTNDMWIGDVGQGAWEEVNFTPASSTGGENYGWDCMEGFHCTASDYGCICNSPSLQLPILNYSHGSGRCSVTGGYVYRGCAVPEIYGHYFYADYCANTIWSVRWDGNDVLDSTNRTAELDPPGGLSIATISSFGEDAYGELYICDLGGEIFKIVPDTMTDCNNNSISDLCDIQFGISQDVNHNSIPDECEQLPCNPVDNLTATVENDSLHLYWTANGIGNETYTVWKSAESSAVFPTGWSVVVSGLPFQAGPNAMSYSDPISASDEILFYVVTAVCP